ncbi:retrovirus-related pol polyprotein from transposon opus [Plakobranchus ocellatus]|uniref:Retrovirus-related pol polyprotein from transposon opus n=1 Tax=Plakobranchus ocellatus TaxID=259542 RepID=A0AAV4CF20_9GAST|nr:retrovirus-related pol polyprotein from transposon opus [Plakobranchus ocellatus]
MMPDISNYAGPCHRCQVYAKRLQGLPIEQSETISRPFDKIEIDIADPLNIRRSSKMFILPMVDAATRRSEAVPLQEKTLKTLQRANFTIKASKTTVGNTYFQFPRHIIASGEIKSDDAKTQKILNIRTLTTKKEVRKILGLLNSEIANTLMSLTKKNGQNKIIWPEECKKSLNKLKQVLTSEPILSAPSLSKPFFIQTEASNFEPLVHFVWMYWLLRVLDIRATGGNLKEAFPCLAKQQDTDKECSRIINTDVIEGEDEDVAEERSRVEKFTSNDTVVGFCSLDIFPLPKRCHWY